MKVSVLIQTLQDIQKEEGDVEVKIISSLGFHTPINSVNKDNDVTGKSIITIES